MDIRQTDSFPADIVQWWTPISDKFVWFVVYEDEEWIAFGGIQLMPYGPYMGPSYVRRAWRGQGLQRKLIEVREAWAKENGYNVLTSCVYSDNVVSRKNLEMTGFKIVRECLDGNKLEIWYEKHLGV